jgi:hypothetical protein
MLNKDKIRARLERKILRVQDSVESFNALAKAILKNANDIALYNLCNSNLDFSGHTLDSLQQYLRPVTHIFFYDIYFGKQSNSHSCPKGGVTNWTGNHDKPMYYLGWGGRVYFRCERNDERKYVSYQAFSNAINGIAIHTESGGGSVEGSTYHFKMFVEEWPGLFRAQVFDILLK